MLGSRVDAEDAVQETWIRFARQELTSIDNVGGWLTTVVSRVCIDVLRSRSARPESLYGDHLPELVVTEEHDAAPESNALLAESVGAALLIVLNSLEPNERLAFVLHDLFAVPFEEIGRIVGKSSNATKMLASRARRKVQGAPRPGARAVAGRAVVDQFLRAARDGDFEGLMAVLDPNVTSRTHTARSLIISTGASEVAAAALRGGRAATTERSAVINGEPGIIARSTSGQIVGLMACAISEGRIVDIVALTDRRRLEALEIPSEVDGR